MFSLSSFTNLLLIFVLNLICPVIMIVTGYYIKVKHSHDLKEHNGYNSFISRKSQINWECGQKIAPVVFISNGLELILIELALSIALVLTKVTMQHSIMIGNFVGACFFFLAFIMTDAEIVKNAQE